MNFVPKWIDRGKFVTDLIPAQMPDDPNVTFRLFGLARCRGGQVFGRQCTVIEWDAEYCHPDCLDFLCSSLLSGEIEGPFVLKIFRIGWFAELHENGQSACTRIDQIKSLRGVETLPNIQFLAAERDAARVREEIKLIEHGYLSDRLIVSKIEKDGSAPLVNVGPNSMLARVTGLRWASSGSEAMETRFQGFDDVLASDLKEAHACGKPRLHETWALLPNWADEEAWWLRTHRLLVPRKDDTVASYCMQGEFKSSLQTTFFGRPGREISVSAQV